MVVNTPFTWLPRAIRTEMATTEMKARIKAYSTRVWPFLLFIRRKARLALNNYFVDHCLFTSFRMPDGRIHVKTLREGDVKASAAA